MNYISSKEFYKVKKGMQSPSDVVELTLFIEPYKEVCFELFKLCKHAAAIPVSTASCEQSFCYKIKNKIINNNKNDTIYGRAAVFNCN